KRIAPPGATLTAQHSPASISVGERFTDLEVEWAPDRFADISRVPMKLYATSLALILGATALAGYLLLRDVNRQFELADLRSHFVSSVSHELKTPLTAIRMLADMLAMNLPQ